MWFHVFTIPRPEIKLYKHQWYIEIILISSYIASFWFFFPGGLSMCLLDPEGSSDQVRTSKFEWCVPCCPLISSLGSCCLCHPGAPGCSVPCIWVSTVTFNLPSLTVPGTWNSFPFLFWMWAFLSVKSQVLIYQSITLGQMSPPGLS